MRSFVVYFLWCIKWLKLKYNHVILDIVKQIKGWSTLMHLLILLFIYFSFYGSNETKWVGFCMGMGNHWRSWGAPKAGEWKPAKDGLTRDNSDAQSQFFFREEIIDLWIECLLETENGVPFTWTSSSFYRRMLEFVIESNPIPWFLGLGCCLSLSLSWDIWALLILDFELDWEKILELSGLV
jgi:hypothetical protein